jgi:ribose transport system permease protein
VLVFAAADTWQTDGGTFLTVRNFRAIAAQNAVVAVAALGMTLVIIAGGIDLSAGTAVALSSTVLAWALKEDVTPLLAVALAVGTGSLCGLLNGTLISLLRVVPFIVTLGTMTLFLGVAKIVANETTVRPDRATQVPEWLVDFLSIRTKALWAGLPAGVWLALVLAVVLACVLRYTVFGRYVFALGSNEATARLCGINVPANKIAVYALAGFFVGIAGLYQFALLSTGSPTSGIGMELKIIAAVVIGGGSLSGGRGSVLGTLTGVAIMSVIASGCTQLGLSDPVQDIILGVIIVAAVAIDQLRQRRLGG